jgi:hypothetical protein
MGLLHIDIDRESSGVFSPQGFRLSAAAGAFYHAVGSANARLVMLSAARTISWSPNNVVGLAVDANSYLRSNVAAALLPFSAARRPGGVCTMELQ